MTRDRSTFDSRNMEDLDALLDRIRSWHADVVKDKPKLEDGRSYKIEFEGGSVGYGADDEPCFSFTVTTTKMEDV